MVSRYSRAKVTFTNRTRHQAVAKQPFLTVLHVEAEDAQKGDRHDKRSSNNSRKYVAFGRGPLERRNGIDIG